jgi:hypothetical protein
MYAFAEPWEIDINETVWNVAGGIYSLPLSREVEHPRIVTVVMTLRPIDGLRVELRIRQASLHGG